jgi:chaperonin GroEL (HSP60 family)
LNNRQVEHPAAKLLVMATQQQEQEAGDATNFVLVFAGALMEHAEDLIRMVRQLSLLVNIVWNAFYSCHSTHFSFLLILT